MNSEYKILMELRNRFRKAHGNDAAVESIAIGAKPGGEKRLEVYLLSGVAPKKNLPRRFEGYDVEIHASEPMRLQSG